MKYYLFGEEVEIYSMTKVIGSIFRFHGNAALKDIGLAEEFYFQAPYHFSITPDFNEFGQIITDATNHSQVLLGDFLRTSIWFGRLVNQFVVPGDNLSFSELEEMA